MNILQALFTLGSLVSVVIGIVLLPLEPYLPQWFLQFLSPNTGHITKTKNKKNFSVIEYLQVPRSWFSHFYVYAEILQLCVFFALVKIFTATSESQRVESLEYKILEGILNILCGTQIGLGRADGKTRNKLTVDSTTILVSFLLLLQVSRRVYECYFVSIFSGSKMNISYYILGFFHYTCSIFAVCAHNFSISGSGSIPNYAERNITYFQIVGVVIFLYGWYQQFKAHLLFAELRKPSASASAGKKVATLKHRIPVGGLFETVSCPNYWAEILIYVSLAAVFGFANTDWNFIAAFVASNQIVSGLLTHKWYRSAFPDYPKERKAIIPYIL